MRILGLTFAQTGAAAALSADGRILAAAEEERFTRLPDDSSFPANAIAFCLERAGLSPADLDGVAYSHKPLLSFERVLLDHMARWPAAPRRFVLDLESWLGKRLKAKSETQRRLGVGCPVYFTGLHEALAAAAFFASPLTEAAVATVAEGRTTVHRARGFALERVADLDSATLSRGELTAAAVRFTGCRDVIYAGDSIADAVVGAALLTEALLEKRRPASAERRDLGPEFSDDAIAAYLRRAGIPFDVVESDRLACDAAGLLRAGSSLGWFQGRMEIGGATPERRCILRAVPREQADADFDALNAELARFDLGVSATPLKTDTLPIACTPQDAFTCFAEAGLTELLLGHCLVRRERLPYLRAAR